jgi:glutathione S-transferase
MRMHSTITSPYARKVWVVAYETGLVDKIERIPTNPHADEYLRSDNPLCRVPTLIRDDGEALFDSPVICEYLDSLHQGHKLFPLDGPARWRALRLQAVGDGLLDANLSRRNEILRPANEQSRAWIDRQLMALSAGCQWLEQHVDELEETSTVDIGHIAVGCALGYFSVRFPTDKWRNDCPMLARWQERFEQRPSMIATRYDTLKRTLPPELIKEGPSRH